jgi:hypothetical protein
VEHVLKTRCAKTFTAKIVKPGQLTAENERLRASPTMCTVAAPSSLPLPIAIGMSTITTDFEMV